jgi:hypothetical protein
MASMFQSFSSSAVNLKRYRCKTLEASGLWPSLPVPARHPCPPFANGTIFSHLPFSRGGFESYFLTDCKKIDSSLKFYISLTRNRLKMSVIHGLLERISFHNEENDFVVAKLREKEEKELTTMIGTKKALAIAIRNSKP